MTPPLILVRRVGFALLAAAALSACGGSDGPTPPPSAATITPEAATNNQEATPGATLPVPIRVRVTGADGAAVGFTTVNWQVSSGGGTVSPTSSTTNSNGIAETQWTLGPTPGTQTVTASVGTARATIVAIASSIESCSGALNLQVGQVCLATPAQAANLSVQGGTAGGEFVAIPFYDGNFARTSVPVSAMGVGVVPVVGPPNPALAPSFSAATIGPSTPQLLPNIEFERRLRRREREELVPLTRGWHRGGETTALATPSFSVAPALPRLAVGDVTTLNVNPNSACNTPENRQAVVRHESQNAVFMEDTQNPAGGFTDADYVDLAQSFESHIWPVDTGAFGAPTDIDNNGKVVILYTMRVNQLTAPGSSSFVGGFFFSRDLFRKTASTTPTGRQLEPCPASNEKEMFYMLAPDPNGVHGLRWTTAQVKRLTLGTTAHELQHLLNASRRLYVNAGAVWPETVWMEEGLSHIAEELVYYRASGFTPRSNLDSTTITSSQAMIDIFNQYQISNIGRFRNYLRATPSQSPYGESNSDDDLETRGAMWSFLRWAADRQPTDGTIWRQLVNGTQIGAENLKVVFGNSIGGRFREWAGAHYLDDVHPTIPQALQHRSWHFRSVVPRLEPSPRPPYPLNTIALTATAVTVTLVDGGAAYFRFGVPANVTATVNITSSGASVWVARTK
jgi:hypothetical protein